jgi:hypothetical protein
MLDFSVGLSGCKLELIDSRVLRKYSSSINYNSRLSLQVNKQVLFSHRILKNIDTPKVHNIQDGYFDMEYIPGKSFVKFFSTSSIKDIEFVIDTLFEYFDSLISNYRLINVQPNIDEKIKFLKNKTCYKNYLEYIELLIGKQDVYVPKTFCHGDLTFNNIIFHKNRLFFIDFLDCYVDSFISDLVKLKQDLYHLWGIKTQNIQSNRLEQIYKHIWNQLYYRYSKFIDTDEFDILEAMNSLRIEPYLTFSDQRSILDTMVKSSKLYADFNNSYGGKV